LTSGKTEASLLKQLCFRKLATRRKLSTDHSDQTQVGLDESLPGQRSLVFEQDQFLLCGIGKASARQSRSFGQQSGLDYALQLDKLNVGQQWFVGDVVVSLDHAHTVRQMSPLATPTNSKSVDKLLCPEPEGHTHTHTRASSVEASEGEIRAFAGVVWIGLVLSVGREVSHAP